MFNLYMQYEHENRMQTKNLSSAGLLRPRSISARSNELLQEMSERYASQINCIFYEWSRIQRWFSRTAIEERRESAIRRMQVPWPHLLEWWRMEPHGATFWRNQVRQVSMQGWAPQVSTHRVSSERTHVQTGGHTQYRVLSHLPWFCVRIIQLDHALSN